MRSPVGIPLSLYMYVVLPFWSTQLHPQDRAVRFIAAD